MTEAQIAEQTAELERKLREEAEIEKKKTTFTPEQWLSLEKWRAEYRRVFTEAGLDMFRVVESANRYCGDRCCPHSPAVTITTRIGDISFWWRKRVAVLDWKASQAEKSSHELFPECKDTHDDSYVHCWTYESAIERLKVVVGSVVVTP